MNHMEQMSKDIPDLFANSGIRRDSPSLRGKMQWVLRLSDEERDSFFQATPNKKVDKQVAPSVNMIIVVSTIRLTCR